jgi:tetratricopeptide (TPR) repeat protein
MGYLPIINRYYEEDLSFLRNYILKKFFHSLKDILKKSEDILKKSEDILKKSEDILKELDSLKDILKKSEDILKKSEDILKKSEDILKKSEDILKKSEVVPISIYTIKGDLIEAWNKQGLIYSSLVGLQSEEKDTYLFNAMKCFDEALKYDEYNSQTLVRKGLVHMEMEHEYKEAIENFEKALRYSRENILKPFRYRGYRYSSIDISNLLGILYYQDQDYHKAIENFEKALEIDNQHELASHNKMITLRKLNKTNSNGKTVLQ